MLAPLLHAWNLNLGYAKRLVADIPDDKMALQPAPAMNHAAWVLGHLAYTADMLGAMVGVKPVCPPEWTALFDWNSSPSSDASKYPSKSVLLTALEDAHAGVAAALAAVPESRWTESTPIEEVRGFLPFMEEQAIYNQFNFTLPSFNTSTSPMNNLALSQKPLKNFLCPSNTAQDPVRTGQSAITDPNNDAPWGAYTFGGADYTGSLGHVWSGWKDCGAVPEFTDPENKGRFGRGGQGTPWVWENGWDEQTKFNGVFKQVGPRKLSDIVDGTSRTIAVFENMHWNGGNGATFDYGSTADAAWVNPNAVVDSLVKPLNNTNPAWQYGGGDIRCHGWSSNHPNGAHALRADGSSGYFNENMDHFVRYCLATARGREAQNE